MKNASFRNPIIHKVKCPSCKQIIYIDEFQLEEDEVVDCPACWAMLQIVSEDPLMLEAFYLNENDFE